MIKSDNFGVTMGTLNINSISSKFDEFKIIVSGLFNIRTVTETKLDHSFREAQFCLNGFSIPLRLDKNRKGVGLMIYLGDDITSKMLIKYNLP